jgi:hypothetical protein
MSHGIIFTCQTVPTLNNFQHVLIQVLVMHTCLNKTCNHVSTGSQAQVEHPDKLAMSMVMYNTAYWNKEHFTNHISLQSQYMLQNGTLSRNTPKIKHLPLHISKTLSEINICPVFVTISAWNMAWISLQVTEWNFWTFLLKPCRIMDKVVYLYYKFFT